MHWKYAFLLWPLRCSSSPSSFLSTGEELRISMFRRLEVDPPELDVVSECLDVFILLSTRSSEENVLRWVFRFSTDQNYSVASFLRASRPLSFPIECGVGLNWTSWTVSEARGQVAPNQKALNIYCYFRFGRYDCTDVIVDCWGGSFWMVRANIDEKSCGSGAAGCYVRTYTDMDDRSDSWAGLVRMVCLCIQRRPWPKKSFQANF